jgi:hypothetical protein
MGTFSITSNVNQLIVSYQSGIEDDDEVNLMTFINPSLEVKNGLFKFFESGVYKKTIAFAQLGDIVDVRADDVLDAVEKITDLIAGFNS